MKIPHLTQEEIIERNDKKNTRRTNYVSFWMNKG